MLNNKENVFIQNISSYGEADFFTVDVLRLDVIHPIVSGNKYFKLRLQLQDAIAQQKNTIVTFGGAFSNHIVATAFASKALHLKCFGIIRGEEPKQLSHTLLEARGYGMELIFVSRTDFKNRCFEDERLVGENYYLVPEGGYSVLGAEGVKEMYNWIDETYTHIVCAVGTGTMMAGLVKGALPHQTVIGISALRGNESLLNEIESLLTNDQKKKKYKLLHDYHFGGYAKHPQALTDWMNELYAMEKIPTDIVYTSKMMYGLKDLLQQNYFPKGSKIMAIHSGGLQGNASLSKTTLLF